MHIIEAGPQGDPGRRPLVLLHGVGTGARAWKPQIQAFAADRWVLAPDLPGFGRSPGPFSIPEAVTQLSGALEERGITRIDLVGLSLGALVALMYAVVRTDEIASLTLCAGFAQLPPELRAIQSGMSEALRAMQPQEFARALDGLSAAVPEPWRAEAREDVASFTPDSLADVMREAGRFQIAQSVIFLRIPALVLCGDRDETNKPLSEDLKTWLQEGRLQFIPNAGHVANLDNPEAFNAALRTVVNGEQ